MCVGECECVCRLDVRYVSNVVLIDFDRHQR